MRRFALFLLLIPFAVLAQSDDIPIITHDETVNLTVTADNRAVVSYIVDEARHISIEIDKISDEFDPVIWIVDSNNRLRAYNDNSAESNTAHIETLFLTPDAYTIFVDSFNGVSEGEIELTLQAANPFVESSTVSDDITSIIVHLPEDLVYRYALEVSEGESIEELLPVIYPAHSILTSFSGTVIIRF